MIAPTKVEPVLRRFLQMDAQALVLTPGERMYVMRGGEKLVVGKDPIKVELFQSVAAELGAGKSVDELIKTRAKIPVEVAGLDPTEAMFVTQAGAPTLMFRRVSRPSAPDFAMPTDLGAPEPPPEPAPPVPAVHASPAAPPGAAPAGDPGVGKRAIDRILLHQLELKASDTHLSSDCHPVMRVHGEMKEQTSFAKLDSAQVEELLAPITPDRNREEFARRNDTDFAYEIPGHGRFRVNVFRDRKGAGAVFRQIPTKILTAKELGLPDAIVKFGELHKGLVVVTGPTGSGKSTTLAAVMDHINLNRTDHIITIEDPIEFVHPNKKCLVNQREVGVHTDSFKNALRAALREDPDIVLVGEMRDLETVSIAIETAETGHLVFGTLHTTTAVSTVDRIIDQFPADRQQQIRMMLSTSLKGVVAQTLCKKIGGGRVAALEVLIVTSAVANLIREGKIFQIPSVMQTSKNIGMVTLNDALLELVQRRKIEPREAYLKSVDKPALVASMKTANIPLPEEAMSKE